MLFNFIGQQGLLTSGNHLTKRFQDHYKAFVEPLQSVCRTITKHWQHHYQRPEIIDEMVILTISSGRTAYRKEIFSIVLISHKLRL